MDRRRFHSGEAQVTREEREKCFGTARIQLSQIHFGSTSFWRPDAHELLRAHERFHIMKLERFKPMNRIKAIVSYEDLNRALQVAGVGNDALRNSDPAHYPLLHFPNKELICLHGRYRVEVGRMVLPPFDRWWAVDLYPPDISQDLRTDLEQEYANEVPHCDGEIYINIHRYRELGDTESENRWWARLSGRKSEKVRSMMKHHTLSAAFDRLRAVPALWNGVHWGVWHRIKSLHCDEEIKRYLDEIWNFWGGLVDFRRELMALIDRDTVDTLQSLAPGTISEDRAAIESQIRGNQLFRRLSEPNLSFACEKAKSYKWTIPTLLTFFQDIHILQHCAGKVMRLLDEPMRGTIRSTMMFMFEDFENRDGENQNHQCRVQVSERESRHIRCEWFDRFGICYQQVWLCAIRHCLRANRIRMRNLPNIQLDDRTALYKLASLARDLGFSSHAITRLITDTSSEPNEEIQPIPPSNHIISLYPVMKDRYGIPHAGSFKDDRRHLFLNYMHSAPEQHEKITSIFVLQCQYLRFFGELPMNTIPEQPSPDNHDNATLRAEPPPPNAARRAAGADNPSVARHENETANTNRPESTTGTSSQAGSSVNPSPLSRERNASGTESVNPSRNAGESGSNPEARRDATSGTEPPSVGTAQNAAGTHYPPITESENESANTNRLYSRTGTDSATQTGQAVNSPAPSRDGTMDDADPVDSSRGPSHSDPSPDSRPSADATTANPAQNNTVPNTEFLNTDGSATNRHDEQVQQLEQAKQKWLELESVLEQHKYKTESLLQQVENQLGDLNELCQQNSHAGFQSEVEQRGALLETNIQSKNWLCAHQSFLRTYKCERDQLVDMQNRIREDVQSAPRTTEIDDTAVEAAVEADNLFRPFLETDFSLTMRRDELMYNHNSSRLGCAQTCLQSLCQEVPRRRIVLNNLRITATGLLIFSNGLNFEHLQNLGVPLAYLDDRIRKLDEELSGPRMLVPADQVQSFKGALQLEKNRTEHAKQTLTSVGDHFVTPIQKLKETENALSSLSEDNCIMTHTQQQELIGNKEKFESIKSSLTEVDSSTKLASAHLDELGRAKLQSFVQITLVDCKHRLELQEKSLLEKETQTHQIEAISRKAEHQEQITRQHVALKDDLDFLSSLEDRLQNSIPSHELEQIGNQLEQRARTFNTRDDWLKNMCETIKTAMEEEQHEVRPASFGNGRVENGARAGIRDQHEELDRDRVRATDGATQNESESTGVSQVELGNFRNEVDQNALYMTNEAHALRQQIDAFHREANSIRQRAEHNRKISASAKRHMDKTNAVLFEGRINARQANAKIQKANAVYSAAEEVWGTAEAKWRTGANCVEVSSTFKQAEVKAEDAITAFVSAERAMVNVLRVSLERAITASGNEIGEAINDTRATTDGQVQVALDTAKEKFSRVKEGYKDFDHAGTKLFSEVTSGMGEDSEGCEWIMRLDMEYQKAMQNGEEAKAASRMAKSKWIQVQDHQDHGESQAPGEAEEQPAGEGPEGLQDHQDVGESRTARDAEGEGLRVDERTEQLQGRQGQATGCSERARYEAEKERLAQEAAERDEQEQAEQAAERAEQERRAQETAERKAAAERAEQEQTQRGMKRARHLSPVRSSKRLRDVHRIKVWITQDNRIWFPWLCTVRHQDLLAFGSYLFDKGFQLHQINKNSTLSYTISDIAPRQVLSVYHAGVLGIIACKTPVSWTWEIISRRCPQLEGTLHFNEISWGPDMVWKTDANMEYPIEFKE